MSGARPRVIKQGTPAAASEDPLAAVEARARAMLADAERDAARILASAAEVRLAAVAAGHAEGMATAAAALARVAEVREERLAALDGIVAEVALDVARRVIGEALAANAEAVRAMARRALRAAASGGDVVLRVASADLTTVREAHGDLAALVERGSLTVLEDPSLARGEVVVESAGGRVDARIDAQLDAFRRALQAEGGR
ncbi:MAG TPA: FliH/SctL family protein [Anaeromyxobacteraceae bacterium]|nr:FliH/SctL family protein [Anaeromyxobacteraceae bacterium]